VFTHGCAVYSPPLYQLSYRRVRSVYPWEARHHAEDINDRDFELEYLIMLSNRCFHLRRSVFASSTTSSIKKDCFYLRRAWTVIFLRKVR
jgi:hypothetical protein